MKTKLLLLGIATIALASCGSGSITLIAPLPDDVGGGIVEIPISWGK